MTQTQDYGWTRGVTLLEPCGGCEGSGSVESAWVRKYEGVCLLGQPVRCPRCEGRGTVPNAEGEAVLALLEPLMMKLDQEVTARPGDLQVREIVDKAIRDYVEGQRARWDAVQELGRGLSSLSTMSEASEGLHIDTRVAAAEREIEELRAQVAELVSDADKAKAGQRDQPPEVSP